jgi:hypothetical protein
MERLMRKLDAIELGVLIAVMRLARPNLQGSCLQRRRQRAPEFAWHHWCQDKVPKKIGSIVVMDRGHIDYKLFSRWTKEEIHFVTRLKENADFMVLEHRPVPKGSNVTKDQIICLNPFMLAPPCREDLRLVLVWDEENQREIQLLTNIVHLSAATISAIYKERWQIELFFKALKQSLKIKTFVGTSANAVRTQIWAALIAMLLIKILQQRSTFGWALSNLIALLRWNLFTYRCLSEWINRPFDTPPEAPPNQLELFDLDSIQQPT